MQPNQGSSINLNCYYKGMIVSFSLPVLIEKVSRSHSAVPQSKLQTTKKNTKFEMIM